MYVALKFLINAITRMHALRALLQKLPYVVAVTELCVYLITACTVVQAVV